MCDPSAIGLGISAAGTVFSAIGSRSVEKAQAKASIAQTKYTLSNFANQVGLNNTKYAQEVEAANEAQQQIYLENLQRKSIAQTSAAGNGVIGASIDSLFQGYDRATALSNFMGERNIRNMGLQYDENYEALRANAVNSIYGLPQIKGQSAGSTLLSGVGGILSTTASSDLFSKLTGK